MITVEAAQALCLDPLTATDTETVPLAGAAGRTLRVSATAHRAQPPFAASAMDGYAIPDLDAGPGASFAVIGEAAAGHGWAGTVTTGTAVRIFTGAPLPEGATRVVIQEDVTRDGDTITLIDTVDPKTNIRPAGADFPDGFTLPAPRLLSAADLALLAAMNVPEVTVSRRPRVALIATGDELIMPGGTPGADQIIASNLFALKALVDSAGGDATLLPIARDTEASLRAVLETALAYDLIVTIGGASVGDHDLVGQVAADFGLERAFYKIAMRPGKPLMSGSLRGTPFLGLPGNPVSAIVCGQLFMVPIVRRLLGQSDVLPRTVTAELTTDLPANGPRTHYMRAILDDGADGRRVTPANRQDSALLTVLAEADVLLVRPIADPVRKAGECVDVLQF